ncbi:MAG: DUF502 domain-containing protein [Verrucomicrobia bacterium]|nr:DUF502 domain-containing protein [Verrucomicrobiota bacterium]
MASCKDDFLTGLAVVLPATVSIWVVVWLFGTVARFTDTLLVLVPKTWTHAGNGEGAMHLYCSVLALALALLAVVLVGRLARYYFGKKLIQVVDVVFMRVPLLNRIYRTLKQINGALVSGKAATFRQVVLVQFPRPGLYSVGFVTNTQNDEVRAKTRESLLSVFVPAPPLTSGSIVLVPEAEVVKLDMTVAEGLKFIMSLGSVSSVYPSPERSLSTRAGGSNGSGAPRNGSAPEAGQPEDFTRFEGEGGFCPLEPVAPHLGGRGEAGPASSTRAENRTLRPGETTASR